MKKLLLTLLGVLLALPGLARDFEYEYAGQTLIYTVIDYDAKTCMTKAGYNDGNYRPGNNVSGELTIPEIAKDGHTEYSVITIGPSAFFNCSGLTEVTIPNSVTLIDDHAFGNCSNLTQVIIGNSVTSIRNRAFSNCNCLKKSAYPNTISDNPFPKGVAVAYNPAVAIIEDNWIYGSEKTEILFAPLTLEGEYVIPETVTSIGEYAFSHCSGLTQVIIPKSVTTIGDHPFSNCSGLKKSAYPNTISNPFPEGYCIAYNPDEAIIEDNWIYGSEKSEILFAPCTLEGEYVIPETVTSIGEYAFSHCSGLTQVTIPNSVTTIERGVFAYCSGLTQLTIPNSVTTIGLSAFQSCSGLTQLTIPNSVTTIGSSAFQSCSGLTQVTIPNSVTSIGEYAFYYCSGLTQVIIGNSVTAIGQWAFSGCNGLKKSAYPNTISDNPFPKGVAVAYNPAVAIIEDNWIYGSEKTEILFAPLTLKGEYVIPETVTSIADYAFYGCSGLTRVKVLSYMPPEIRGGYAFYGLYDTVKLEVPAGALYNYMLTYWYYFKNIYREGSDEPLSAYNDGVFNYMLMPAGDGYERNTAVVMPGNYSGDITIPERFAYTDSQGETERYYVEGIGCNAFYGSSINSVQLNSRIKLKNIGDWAFNKCSNLTDITLPEGLETIGYCAFQSCAALTAIDVPSTVTTIGEWAFNNCSKLTNVTLGNSLTSIEYRTFRGTALKEVVIPPSVETIGAEAFMGCSSLASIAMGHSVRSIGEKAFDGCPAKTVYITAQTPPEANTNTFSNYTGKLYLQGQAAIDAYYDAYTCWDRFNSYLMVEPTEMVFEGADIDDAKPGDRIQFTARLIPENVTLPQIFWRSTNPEIATVDGNGLVTIHADLKEIMSAGGDVRPCKIIAESLYANIPKVEVSITDTNGIGNVVNDGPAGGEFDPGAPVEVYNLNGIMVATSTDNLVPGLYIVRQGSLVKKIAVR